MPGTNSLGAGRRSSTTAKFLPRNRSIAPLDLLAKAAAPAHHSWKKALLMHRPTLTSGHSLRRRVSPICRCRWPKGLLPDNHPQCAAAAPLFRSWPGRLSVVLIGARLNWPSGVMANHRSGRPTHVSCRFDISPTEIDSNRPIAAPRCRGYRICYVRAFFGTLKPGQIKVQFRVDQSDW